MESELTLLPEFQELERLSAERGLTIIKQQKSEDQFIYHGVRFIDEESWFGVKSIWTLQFTGERVILQWLTWWTEEVPPEMAERLVEDLERCVQIYY